MNKRYDKVKYEYTFCGKKIIGQLIIFKTKSELEKFIFSDLEDVALSMKST